MRFILLLPPISFLGILFVWSFVFAYKRKDPVAHAYLLFSGFCAAWCGLELLFYVPGFYGYEKIILMTLVPFWTQTGILFLYFSYCLIEKKLDWIFWFFMVASLISMIITLIPDLVFYGYVRHDWGVADEHYPVIHTLVSTPASISALWGLILIARKYIASKDRVFRSILGFLLIGGSSTLPVVCLLNIALPNFFEIYDVPRWGSFTTCMFAFLTFVAVRRNRFLTISVEQVAEDLFEDMHDGVILLDEGTIIRRINKAAASMLGVSDKDSGDLDMGKLFPNAPIMNGQKSKDLELSRNGDTRIIAMSRHASDHGGIARGEIIILRDETERRRAQNVLRHSRDSLEKQVQERTRELRQAQRLEALVTLSGGIAHDFNNLLAAIMGFVTAAQDDLSKTHPVQEDLGEVLKATKRARDIVQQMLSLSTASEPKPRHVNACQLVTEAIKMLQMSQPKNVKTNVNFETRKANLYLDPSRFHQVLLNLITNAYHAMADTGGTLEIKVSTLEVDREFALLNNPLEPGSHVSVVISDTGIGITQQNLLKIFDPFYTTKEEGSGTGLGLATAMRIVQEYRGTIIVDSMEGTGTTFAILLPNSDSDSESDSESDQISIDRGTERILLVDDTEQVLKVGCRMLEPLGYKVTASIDPLEALELFKKSPNDFDILITDLSMPSMSGLSLGREILAIRPGFPLILISGNLSKHDKAQAEEVGFEMMLAKPLSKAAIAMSIRALLDSVRRPD